MIFLTPKFKHALLYEIYAFLGAIRFFTRLPIPKCIPHSNELLNHSARYFPAVGLIVGSISALIYIISAYVFTQSVSVLLAMVTSIYITGAFHEDGLTDMTDGLGGGWEKPRILEIMKDSRVGSYGVIAITMTLLTKYVALSEVNSLWVPTLLILAHSFSRYCSVLIMAGMSYVREDALSKSKPLATHLSTSALFIASCFGVLPLIELPWQAAAAGAAPAILITIWLGRKLQKWIGGYTGDCLGATQQLSEVIFYLGALAALG